LKSLAKFLLITGIGLSSLSLSAQESRLPHETDPYKFVPKGASAEIVTVDTGHGIMNGVWYNKTYKTAKDYQNRLKELGGLIPSDEIFLDIDGDGILDLSNKDLDRLCDQYLEEQKMERARL
jgi:hypothetical protein